MADQAAITQEDWDAVAQEREQGTTTPPETPEVKTEQQTEQQAQSTETSTEATKTDPYEGLHPEIRAKLERFDQMVGLVPDIANQLKATVGRVGKLQSEWEKSRTSGAQPTQTQVAAAAKDPEKWAALKKDFPEWGDAIAEFVESRTPKGTGIDQEALEQLVAQRTEATTATLQKKFNEDLVTVAHRTWKADVKTEEFGAWYRVQKPEVQALSSSTDPFDAISLMDRYYADKKKPVEKVQETRQKRLEAAVTTKPTPAGSTPMKSIEDMSPQELWDYEAAQRAKRAA